jgi:hypothetical protein
MPSSCDQVGAAFWAIREGADRLRIRATESAAIVRRVKRARGVKELMDSLRNDEIFVRKKRYALLEAESNLCHRLADLSTSAAVREQVHGILSDGRTV